MWHRYQRARFLQSRMGTGRGARHAALELLHPGEVHPIGSPAVSVRLGSADVEAYVQVFVDREYDFEYPAEPEVIIDAGAHIGLASAWFAQRFPDAMIVSLELERSNFELLRTNTAAYPNIRPVHAALWPTSGAVAVTDPHAA